MCLFALFHTQGVSHFKCPVNNYCHQFKRTEREGLGFRVQEEEINLFIVPESNLIMPLFKGCNDEFKKSVFCKP